MADEKKEVKLKPLGDRLLVRAVEPEVEEKSGIIIPDTIKEKPQEGEVIAIGRGKTTDNGTVLDMNIKLGDRVLYGKYAGTAVKLNDEDYLILHQADVLGILEGR